MKKYNLYLWLAVLVGLFASCSQDENAMLQTNESNRVSLTAELPDDFAQIGTRALPDAPDGNHKLRCILEVWAEGGTVLKHREEKFDLNGENVEFNFTIDAGTYDCLFWADFIGTTPDEDKEATIGEVTYTHYDDKYYTTNTANGLKAISIITDSYAFNTDARDAFFGKYVLKKGAEAIENPEINALTRPFAKLTIKEKNATNYDACNGLTAEYEVPKTFNVSTGEVEGTKVPVICDNKSSESQILFSDYIFTDATSNLGDVTLNFTGDKTFQTVTIPAGIPLKRNFKTNASGSLITEKPAPTDGVKMTVTMNADWDGNVDKDVAPKWDGESTAQPTSYTGNSQNIVYITSAAELAWLAQQCNGGNKFENYTFNLTTDIDLNKHEWTPIGLFTTTPFKGTFNGQNHTVSNLKCSTSAKAGLFGIIEATVSNVTVNGIISYEPTAIRCYLGGIAGYATDSKIENCTNQCTITATGTNYGAFVGGIVGHLSSASGKTSTLTDNTNTGVIGTNTYGSSVAGCIIGYANSSGSIILTDNTNTGGTPDDVYIGMCSIASGTITIDGTAEGIENGKPYPVPAP